MTDQVQTSVATRANGTRVATLRMTAPRANALTLSLLQALNDALDSAEGVDAILLTGGRNFSTGGDVLAFLRQQEAGDARAYAQELVGRLQDLVYRLITLPALIVAAPRGAVTGGSCGLIFASDLVVGAPDVFLQAYYAKVGFAPDGGWTAILPERIGLGRTQTLLHADQRLDAQELRALGVLSDVSDRPEDAALALLDKDVMSARLTAKRLLWDAPRLSAVRARLDAETRAFVDRIEAPEVIAGMQRFVQAPKAATHA